MLACGKKDTEQKDTLELADVDYGSSGAFTINVWFRHDQENFDSYQREQFFGHGNPFVGTAGSPNQLHWQFEKSGNIRTLTMDGTDATSDDCAYCNGGTGGNNGTEAIEAATGEPCGYNKECWAPYKGYTDTLASEHGAVDNGAMWHMLTLTTHPDGSRGYATYLDGQMRASMPYAGMGVDIFETDPNGNWERVSDVRLGRPIDPEGPMRFCGRMQNRGGDDMSWWSENEPDGADAGWHPNRYFMGKVAHASFFSHAMTKEQVNALMASYVTQYNLPVTPFDLPAGIAQPVAYYALDEGIGFDLKESVSGKIDAGKVIYDTNHQTVTYDQPNWVDVRLRRAPSTQPLAPAAGPRCGPDSLAQSQARPHI